MNFEMRRFKDILPLLGIAAGLTCAGENAHAALSIRLQNNQQVFLMKDGHPVAERPLSFTVQRWRRKAGIQSGLEASAVDQMAIPRSAELLAPDQSRKIHQVLSSDPDIRIDATWKDLDGAVSVVGEIVSQSSEDIPVTFALAVPVEDPKPAWLVDLHRTESIAPGEEKCVTTLTPAGARKAMSRYSFGGILTSNGALGVGFPLDQPRIHRIRWDSTKRALVAECDVTLSHRVQKSRGRVGFAFQIFDAPSEFGFRGLAQTYYQLNSASYTKRVKKEGQWMPFTQLDKVERVEDFGFAFHEYHPDVSVAWDNAHGVKPLVYCEPPVQYISLDDSFPREISKLTEYLETLDTPQGSAVRGGAAYDSTGQLIVEWVNTPWAKGARIPTNCDPDLLRTQKNPLSAFDINWSPYIELLRRRASDTPSEWTGGGILTDGVIGADGRAVYLPSAESLSQKFKSPVMVKNARIVVNAKGRSSARLKAEVVTTEGTNVLGEISLTPEFRPYEFPIPTCQVNAVRFVSVSGEVWLDKVQCPSIPLANPDFETGSLDPEQPAGLYMDSFEGWDSYRLNFRDDHLAASDYPLTFDGESGRTAQVIMMHNFEFAAEVGKRLHERGALLMANTALYQWPWSAHYLDVLGIETPWGHWARTENLDYLRTMLYHKPYCFLLNVAFANFRGEKVEEYFARCFHYGFWPGFFSHDAANNPYWEQSALYDEDRPLFLKYMRVQQRTTAAGWEPVTLATANPPSVHVERWGGGPFLGTPLMPREFYLTCFNNSESTIPVRVHLDSRLTGNKPYIVLEALSGQMLAVGLLSTVDCPLGAHRAVALHFLRREKEAIEQAIAEALDEIEFLATKHVRYGHLRAEVAEQIKKLCTAPSANGPQLRKLLADASVGLPEIYKPEWERAFSVWLTFAAAQEEILKGANRKIEYPKVAVPGSPYSIKLDGNGNDNSLVFQWNLNNHHGADRVTGPALNLQIPRDTPIGSFLTWRIATSNPDQLAPYYVVTVPVLPPILLNGLPQSLTFANETSLDISILNNTDEPKALHIKASPNCTNLQVLIPQDTLKINAGSSTRATIKLQGHPAPDRDEHCELTLDFQSADGSSLAKHHIPVTILSETASVLRKSDVEVTVDSCYLGYSEKPLNDGVTATKGIDWADAAWASDEGNVPHWAEFRFSNPLSLREVKLLWAFDDGHYWNSKKVAVQLRPVGSSEWQTMATVQTEGETSESVVTFAPTKATALRIYQAGGDGPPRRKGILWLREVEAR